MAFVKHVCWRTELLARAINVEALEPDDAYFLATHHPIRMRPVRGLDWANAGDLMTQEELRSQLLDRRRDHMQVVVQGLAGSGKSHLVRWLWVTIPRTPERHVVLIPRAGCNLRDVVKLILEGMQGPAFDTYRDRLERAAGNLTIELARERLLSALAIAVGEHGPHSKALPDNRDEREERQYLIASLPALLRDEAVYTRLASDRKFIDQMARHVVGVSLRDRLQEPRAFALGDLPLDINPTRLGDVASRFYNELVVMPDLRRAVVTWINANLNAAIQGVLDFHGSDLQQLLLDIREQFCAEGKELILLIEDFAKLQGIDTDLLEALLVRPNQANRQLCPLRSVIAVAEGFYAQINDQVKDRINLVVDLNLPLDVQDIAEFTSRYLNAVRLDEHRMVTWYGQVRSRPDSAFGGAPNACEECEHLQVCQGAFGAYEGRGLYPFNAHALREMLTRTPLSNDRTVTFNPRALLNYVVGHTLEQYAGDIRAGQFPNGSSLLSRFTTPKMTAIRWNELKAAHPEQADRYRTLYEFWGEVEPLGGIAEGVFTAFGLQPLTPPPPVDPRPPDPVPPPLEPDKAPPPLLPPKLDAQQGELDAWANGKALNRNTAQELREHLFAAVDAYIDWDGDMLVRSYHCGVGRTFRQQSFYLERQPTQRAPMQVQVKVPLAGDFATAAIALQGMLLFQHHGHWQFANAGKHYRAYLELVRALAREVVAQVRKTTTEQDEWNPVPTVVELLTLGARVYGQLPPTNAPIEKRIDALFIPWEGMKAPEAPREGPWRDLAKPFVARRGDFCYGQHLQRILLSRIACTKGGGLEAQVIDAAALVDAIENTRAGDGPMYPVPSWELRPDFQDVVPKVQKGVFEKLDLAIAAERERHLAWLTRVGESIGPDTKKGEVLVAVRAAFDAAEAEGVAGGPSRSEFEQAVDSFRGSAFDTTLQTLTTLAEVGTSQERGRVLALLGQADLAEPMAVADRFFALAGTFLSKTRARVEKAIEDIEGETDVNRVLKQISTALTTLAAVTNVLSGGIEDVDGAM